MRHPTQAQGFAKEIFFFQVVIWLVSDVCGSKVLKNYFHFWKLVTKNQRESHTQAQNEEERSYHY
jgi:hypothetical protein